MVIKSAQYHLYNPEPTISIMRVSIKIHVRTITEYLGLMESAHQMVSGLLLWNGDEEIQPTTEISTILCDKEI